MNTPDMATYLLERIAEDEAVAREAVADHPGPWYPGDHSDPAVVHIARWDPDRVLAECRVRREIVQFCQWVRDNHGYADWGAGDTAGEVLLHLVQSHADRPDFPPEWLSEVAR